MSKKSCPFLCVGYCQPFYPPPLEAETTCSWS